MEKKTQNHFIPKRMRVLKSQNLRHASKNFRSTRSVTASNIQASAAAARRWATSSDSRSWLLEVFFPFPSIQTCSLKTWEFTDFH